MEKKNVIFYEEWFDAISKLTDKGMRWDAVEAVFRYAFHGEVPQDAIIDAITSVMCSAIDKNRGKYESVCERNRLNGAKGGRPRKENPKNPVGYLETQKNPEKPKKPDNDNDNDNDSFKERIPNGIPKKDELSLSPPPSSKSNSSEVRIDYNGIMETFNRMFEGKAARATCMTEKRKAAVKARVAEHGLEAVDRVFDNVLRSAFLLGRNDRGWICDFDWIFRPTNFIKILEGNYNDENRAKIELTQDNHGNNNRSNYTSKQEANAYAFSLLQQHKRDIEAGILDQMEKPF